MVVRYYLALTNKCNRSCELCSCFSGPERNTFLALSKFKEILSISESFELQLEGGEPLLHPELNTMIAFAQNTGRCSKITLGTNASLLPFSYSGKKLDNVASIKAIKDYFLKFKPDFILKPSINYHLIDKDPQHLDKAEILKCAFEELKVIGNYQIIFNVRRRKFPMVQDEDNALLKELEKRDLTKISNIFFYQRYGYAENKQELDKPFIISNPVEFYLFSPDGKNWGTDLIARSNGMKGLK